MRNLLPFCIFIVVMFFINTTNYAQIGTVKGFIKYSSFTPQLTKYLKANDRFGSDVEYMGDLDGDSVGEIAVGAHLDDDGGTDRGAIYILFLNKAGGIKKVQKISSDSGNFTCTLPNSAWFGIAIKNIGDVDKDGVPDIVVGAPNDNDNGTMKGSIFLLLMKKDGTVKSCQKYAASTSSVLASAITDNARFGISIDTIGDLDKNGTVDFVVGAPCYRIGGVGIGAVYILFMNSNGTVKNAQLITNGMGGFTGTIVLGNYFAHGVTCIGDLNRDGIPDIAVTERENDEGGSNKGAVYIFFMNSNGTIKSYQKINDVAGNFSGVLNNNEYFGNKVKYIGDIDGDGNPDIAVGAPDIAMNTGNGKVFTICLNSTGTVKSYQKIGQGLGNFTGTISSLEGFGFCVALMNDVNGDGKKDLLVGEWGSNDGGTGKGAAYILYLNSVPTAKITTKSSTSFCQGLSATLKADTLKGYTYSWLKNGIPIPGVNTSFYNAVSSGDYRAIVTFNNVNDTSNIITITVGPHPTANITTTSPTIFCQGKFALLKADTASGYTYRWLMNNYPITGATFPTYIANSKSGNYRVLVTKNGCQDTSNTIPVTINPLPVASISTTDPTTFCNGKSALLTADSLTGYSFQWLRNNLILLPSTFSKLRVTKAGDYKVVVSNTSCSDTSNHIFITVNPLPAVNATTKDSTTFCQGSKATLKADSVSGNFFKWLKNGNYYPGGDYSILNVSSPGLFRVVVYNSWCSDTSKTFNIILKPLPVANISTTDPTTFCQGLSAALLADSVTGYSFKWLLNGIPVSGAFSKTLKATKAGKYTAIVSLSNCPDTSQEIILIVNPKPPKPVVIKWGKMLYSNTPNGNQWYNSKGLLPGATDSFYKPAATDYYFVIVTSLKGCSSDTSNKVLYTGISTEADFDNYLQIYPNPNQGAFVIKNIYNEAVRLKIFETSGKMTGDYLIPGGTDQKISLPGITPGVYYIKAELKNGTAVKRMIIY